MVDHGIAQGVGRAAGLEIIQRQALERQQVLGHRHQAELGHVPAVQQRQLSVEGLAEDVGVGVPAQGLDQGAVQSHGLQRLLGAAQEGGQALLERRHLVRGGGQGLEPLQEILRRGLAEGGGVHHQEILCDLALAAGQALAFNAHHLECHATGHRHPVIQQVARDRGQAHHHRVGGRLGEQALRQRRGQPVMHAQLAQHDPVGLGMHAALGLALIL